MASSTLYTCIRSALDDLKLLPANVFDKHVIFSELILGLRSLKLLFLCARGLGKGANLGSVLVRFEDPVRGIAEEIHRYSLHLLNGLDESSAGLHFTADMDEFFFDALEDVMKNYLSVANMRAEPSCHLTADELSELISSISENLTDFITLLLRNFNNNALAESTPLKALRAALEALEEQMTFLKSLILFATHTSVEPSKDLLSHADSISFNAAYIFFKYKVANLQVKEKANGMFSEISTLLQQIRPIDPPQVLEIYTEVLTGSKLSRRLLATAQHLMDDDDAYNAFKNILDYFISGLFKLLQLNTCHVLGSKEADQLQELYEGLRSLRSILKQKPNNFDLKTTEDICDVVCDVGVLILSSSESHTEIDLGLLPDLLETIKSIQTNVGEEDNSKQPTTFNFPMTNQLGFVDFVLEKIMELITSSETEPTAKSHLQTIQDGLVFLRCFMGDVVELRKEREEVQAIWDRVLQMAYQVECLIDHLLIGDIPYSFSASIDSIIKDTGDIKADVLEIFPGERREIKASRTDSNLLSSRPASITNEVVGFDAETRSIKDQLMEGSMQLRIVSIVGMPGLGKTTLATKVYNDSSIVRHFSAQAWCVVSQAMDKRRVLLELLNQTNSNKCSMLVDSKTTTEHDIAQELWRSLKERRYLIFLDDIWSIEAWNNLQMSFPDDSRGSRIIFISRVHDVAPRKMLFGHQPLSLRPLNNEESLELLQRKLFPGNGWPPASHDLGMQIAEMCKGLPLTIVIVAGLLKYKGQEDLKEIVDRLSLGLVLSTDLYGNILEMSYNHLPDELRPCFLYFGVFREDQEISVRRLLRLWIAEGFVRKAETKKLEVVAEDHLRDLIGRSLIMVAKTRWDGGVKACRIHDLLRDFCLRKAYDEHFFRFLVGCDQLSSFIEPRNLRRLCIEAEPKHFEKAKLFCPRACSLLFNCPQGSGWYDTELRGISFVINIFKLLRVLDLEQIILSSFPSEVTLLVQLTFLSISIEEEDIPSSIAKLLDLETLIINSPPFCRILLPYSLWNLQKLRCLRTSNANPRGFSYFPLAKENSVNYPDLLVLETLSGVAIILGEETVTSEKLMRKIPNIRRLKCNIIVENYNPKDLYKIVVPDLLSQLESLTISQRRLVFDLTFELSLPAHLRKLSLSIFYPLSSMNISIIGRLPKLEVLKLVKIRFEGNTLEMKEGEFSQLRFLKLRSRDLVRWEACDDQFNCFQKLVLEDCRRLEEMPCCFEDNPTLQMVEVSHCSEAVENWVKQIEEAQENWGNSDLRITIQ